MATHISCTHPLSDSTRLGRTRGCAHGSVTFFVRGRSLAWLQKNLMGGILTVTAAVFAIMSLSTPVRAAAPPAAALDAPGYEIPLGELHKVKKERPPKKEGRERKKKKSESTAGRPAADANVQPKNVEQTPRTPPGDAGTTVSPESQRHTTSGKSAHESSGTPDKPHTATDLVTVHHDPYSYVIAGKRTTIQAVVSSAGSLQAVYCRFRATENGAFARVAMQPVPGTHFTYTATLPGLAAASQVLRYSLVAVDSSGAEHRSQEFAITVRSSAVLPGWQLDNTSDALKISRENREKPLEGFADPGIVE